MKKKLDALCLAKGALSPDPPPPPVSIFQLPMKVNPLDYYQFLYNKV